MTNIRRYYVPGSTVFITQVVHSRKPVFCDDSYIALLRETLHRVQQLHPFAMVGYVFLPDHFHMMIRPTGDSNFSQIMHSLKSNFTYQFKQRENIQQSLHLWQRRFWDHLIRHEDDFANHLDYIHYNPVSHGIVSKPEAWRHSSYVHWRQRDAYPEHWGWALPDTLTAFDGSRLE